jgi:hypothetical protein
VNTPSAESLYAAARRVLLDALEAAAPFLDSVIVVGAQAVYLRTERARLALAGFTLDGDLALDPSSLPTAPPIERALTNAGFVRGTQPGSWSRRVSMDGRDIRACVDFMVPATVAPGAGSRSVELEGHDRFAARRAYGLEAALVDHGILRIAALHPGDGRDARAKVAGPAALLVAKLHKIADRVESGRHARTPVDKDAGDIYRLVQATSVADMAAGLRLALTDDVAAPVADAALRHLRGLFADRRHIGVGMAQRAVGPSGEPEETVAAALTAYVAALLGRL